MRRPRKQTTPRIAAIKRRIYGIDLVCSGTLLERTKLCGKPNCRCAKDPGARHGPYFEWNRRQDGKLHHRLLTTAQARQIRRALGNRQLILMLLDDWEWETGRAVLQGKWLKDRYRRT